MPIPYGRFCVHSPIVRTAFVSTQRDVGSRGSSVREGAHEVGPTLYPVTTEIPVVSLFLTSARMNSDDKEAYLPPISICY